MWQEQLKPGRIQLLTYFLLFCGHNIGAEEVIGDPGSSAPRALFFHGQQKPLVIPLVSNPSRGHGSPRILEEIRTDFENLLKGRQVRNLQDYQACKAEHASDSGIKSLSCLGTLFSTSSSSQVQVGQQGTSGEAYGNQALGLGLQQQQQQWGLARPQQGAFDNGFYGQGQDPYYSQPQYSQGQYLGGQQQLGQDPYYSQGQNPLNQFSQGQGGQYPWQQWGQNPLQGGSGQYPQQQGQAWNQNEMNGGYTQGQQQFQNPYYNRQQQVLGAGTGYEQRSSSAQQRPTRTFYRQSKEPFII